MRRFAAGIDVGGTTIKIGLFDTDGNMLEKWAIPTDTSDHGRNVLPDIAESLQGHLERKGAGFSDLEGAGIGVPGAVTRDGVVNRCVNVGWGIFNLETEFSELMDHVPVKAGNDANVAALGETWKGGGRGYRDIVMVTIGTGLGGGVITDGRIVPGAFGAAGEIGHMTIFPEETEICTCGKRGCLEQYCSATGMVRVARKYLRENPEKDSILLKEDPLTAKALYDAAAKGDPAALAIVEMVCGILGRGLSIVSAVVDPEAFIIGGGVSAAGDVLLDPVRRAYREYAFHASKETAIRPAELGNDAGIIGAAKLVL